MDSVLSCGSIIDLRCNHKIYQTASVHQIPHARQLLPKSTQCKQTGYPATPLLTIGDSPLGAVAAYPLDPFISFHRKHSGTIPVNPKMIIQEEGYEYGGRSKFNDALYDFGLVREFAERGGVKLLVKSMALEEKLQLEKVLVPLGMGVLLAYHAWLLFMIRRNPTRTVIGLNAESRRKWVFCLMEDPLKNGVLAIQTIRNNIMASTLLATVAITLSSLISVYVSNNNESEYHSNNAKFFAVLICFLVAFLCNVQSIRYYAHGSFLVTVPTFGGRRDAMEYVATNLNRGGFFWTLGLRAFYLSFPLFVWVFGAIPMFICCCVMVVILYFLDSTTDLTRDMYNQSMNRNDEDHDAESGR